METEPKLQIKRSEVLKRLKKSGRSVANSRKIGKIDEKRIREAMYSAVMNLEPDVLSRKNEEKPKTLIKEALRKAAEKAAFGLSPVVYKDSLQKIINNVYDEVVGYGPIQPLLRDDGVTEIIVIGPGQGKVLYEKNGKFNISKAHFRTQESLRDTIDKIISPLNRRIDESMPMVDTRLPDGSRVNAVIPPIASDGPYLTIRKFRKNLTAEDLLHFGTYTERDLNFFKKCVKARLNILVSGGTGSGKTTLLNILSSFIPHQEMVVTIEDTLELQLGHPYVRRLESRPPSVDGRGEITIWMLVKNALRMRVHRIVVGEVRGGEAFDMLRAMNTGHDGSLSTIHANSPEESFEAIVTMILLSGAEMPVDAIRRQIASALDMVVQVAMLPTGERKVTKVIEVTGYNKESVESRDLLVFDLDKKQLVPAKIQCCGNSRLEKKFKLHSIDLPDWFARQVAD